MSDSEAGADKDTHGWIKESDGWHFDDGLGGKWFLTHDEMTVIRGER